MKKMSIVLAIIAIFLAGFISSFLISRKYFNDSLSILYTQNNAFEANEMDKIIANTSDIDVKINATVHFINYVENQVNNYKFKISPELKHDLVVSYVKTYKLYLQKNDNITSNNYLVKGFDIAKEGAFVPWIKSFKTIRSKEDLIDYVNELDKIVNRANKTVK